LIYVFDTSSFVVLFKHYYESRFPTLWENFNQLIADEIVLSVKEVVREALTYGKEDRFAQWAKANPKLFKTPSPEEIALIQDLFKQRHFQAIIEKQKLLEGRPVADPFVVAKAKVLNATVVTQEEYKEHGVKIPNVCEYFGVPCTNLEGFMELEDWIF